MEAFLRNFQEMAAANKELAAAATTAATAAANAVKNNTTNNAPTTATVRAADEDGFVAGGAGSVALTDIKIPMDMGEDAEERLVNFHEWKEEVADKMDVAGVKNEKRRTTIALLWGGRDIKKFAIDKANVNLHDTTNVPADGWEEATTKIETAMSADINETFAMFKFRQCSQDQQSIDTWDKKLRMVVKTLGLDKCTCGHG